MIEPTEIAREEAIRFVNQCLIALGILIKLKLEMVMENCYENKCSCGRTFYGEKLQPFCAGCYTSQINALRAELQQLREQEPAGAVYDDGLTDSTDYVQSIINKSNRASPRITEQDARKIIYNFSDNCSQGDFRYWYESKGRALLNKLNANAVAEVRQEPVVKMLSEIKDQQQNAWLAVCKVLDEVKPDWLIHRKKGVDCAVDAIRSLSGPAQAAAIPDDWREIVEAVAHIGIDFGYGSYEIEQDKIDKARALLSASPKPE